MPTILTKSPFLPPDFQPPGTPGQAAEMQKGKQQYEFRGVYELGGVFHYNLYNARDKKGQWVTEETADELGFTIIEYDSEKDSLQLLVNGESMALSMVETSDKPMALASGPGRIPQTAAKATSSRKPAARRRVIRPTTSTQASSTKSPQRRIVRRTPSKS